MSKIEHIYFVLTEEGMVGGGKKTASEALIEYINTNPYDNEWISEILNGESEIHGIVEMTREEYKEWLKTAIEV